MPNFPYSVPFEKWYAIIFAVTGLNEQPNLRAAAKHPDIDRLIGRVEQSPAARRLLYTVLIINMVPYRSPVGAIIIVSCVTGTLPCGDAQSLFIFLHVS